MEKLALFSRCIALATMFLVAGCGICPPGSTQTCTCNGTDTGAQTCSPSGESWNACNCPNTGGTQCQQPTGMQLSVPAYPQQCQEWCWAASISMIASYFGVTVAECQLATGMTGNAYNCCNYQACAFAPCDQGAQPATMSQALTALGLHGNFYPGALSEFQIQNELSHGRPIMLGYTGPFSGHAVVIVGFTAGTPATYHLIDPYFGVFPNLTYQQVLIGPSSGQTQWNATWANLTRGAPTCDYGVQPTCCN